MSEISEVIKPSDPYGYSNLSATELRKVITDLVRSNEEILADKKEYAAAAADAIKGGKDRINKALEFLSIVERTGANLIHENNVTDFLSAKGVTK
jgi:hypothetical protein